MKKEKRVESCERKRKAYKRRRQKNKQRNIYQTALTLERQELVVENGIYDSVGCILTVYVS